MRKTHRQRTYLIGKPRGDSSMFGNSRDGKKLCTDGYDQSLTGMVRAILPETKFSCGLREGGPLLNHSLRQSRCDSQNEPSLAKEVAFGSPRPTNPHLTGQSATSRIRERTGHLPQSIYSWLAVSTGSPKGGDTYGDGKPIVVRRRICEK